MDVEMRVGRVRERWVDVRMLRGSVGFELLVEGDGAICGRAG